MTCLPVSLKPIEHTCACNAEKGDLDTGIGWNDSWEEITESGLTIQRSLCDTQTGWCEGGMFRIFKKNLVYLFEQYEQPHHCFFCV